MQTRTQKAFKWASQHKALSVFILVVIGLLGWWLVANYMPHPLGNKMDYLGKEDYGNIFGFDSRPASVYYYGTDMDINELEKYFGKAEVQPFSGGMSGAKMVMFDLDGDSFIISHYWEKSVAPFSTDKKYIVSIGNGSYSTARKALK